MTSVAVDAPVAPPLEIVPRKALPVVALVLAGVVVAIARDARWGLVFCHVVGGGLWTAIDLFVGFVIGPILRSMSIPARIEFSKRFMPKMLLLMPTLGPSANPSTSSECLPDPAGTAVRVPEWPERALRA